MNLIQAVRQISWILPGDKIKMTGEKPATYLGPLEEGDIQSDFIQLHVFRVHDGVQVVWRMLY